jgi:hypothetical protein
MLSRFFFSSLPTFLLQHHGIPSHRRVLYQSPCLRYTAMYILVVVEAPMDGEVMVVCFASAASCG